AEPTRPASPAHCLTRAPARAPSRSISSPSSARAPSPASDDRALGDVLRGARRSRVDARNERIEVPPIIRTFVLLAIAVAVLAVAGPAAAAAERRRNC